MKTKARGAARNLGQKSAERPRRAAVSSAPVSSAPVSSAHESSVTESSAPDAASLERLGVRMLTETRLLVRALPISARSVRSMAEYLGVDRNLAQRVLTAMRADGGTEFLVKAPGPAQLQLLVEGAALRGMDADRLDGLRAAIDAYASSIVDWHMSPSGFRKLLRNSERSATRQRPGAISTASGSADSVLSRLYEASLAVARASTDAKIAIVILAPDGRSSTGIRQLMVQGCVGYSAEPGGMPMVLFSADRVADESSSPEFLVSSQGDPARRVLLREFCSSPLPKIVPSGVPGCFEHVVTPESVSPNSKIDAFTAISSVYDHPALDSEDRRRSFAAHMSLPSKWLLQDIFLHRSLASACVPECAAMRWNPYLQLNPLAGWANLLPDAPRLEILGGGARSHQSSVWARHGELVQRAFTMAGRDPAEFVGHRMHVPMPIWGMHYVLSFDYSHGPLTASASNDSR